MGKLSKNYKVVTTYSEPTPRMPQPEPDTYKENSGNPHWNKGVTILTNEKIEEVYTYAKQYVKEITDELEDVYKSLMCINELEPLIEFGGLSTLVDERFDALIAQLNDVNEKAISYIEESLQNVESTSERYIEKNTESCRKVRDIINFVTETDDKGKPYLVLKKVGEVHRCGTHGRREYRDGASCEFCG